MQIPDMDFVRAAIARFEDDPNGATFSLDIELKPGSQIALNWGDNVLILRQHPDEQPLLFAKDFARTED